MNYSRLDKLGNILQKFQSESKTQNQILSDLHLYLEMLGDEIKSIKFPQMNAQSEINKSDREIIDSVDFNSALMISNSSPSLIIQSLLDAIILKNYRFFFILCNILFNSELDSDIQNQVKDLYKSVKYEIGYYYNIEDLRELYSLYLITRKLLHITLSDWEQGKKFVKKTSDELFSKVTSLKGISKHRIEWEELAKFKKQLDLKYKL